MEDRWSTRWSQRGQVAVSAGRSSRAGKPGVISFNYGDPDAQSLPLNEMVQAAEYIAEHHVYEALNYQDPIRGDELNQSLAEKLARDQGIEATPEQILVTDGGSGGLSLLCDMLIDPGDVVLIDAPAWMGATTMLRLSRAESIGMPVDDDGIVPDQVAETFDKFEREGRRPKFLYTIPTFQNPSGVELTLERRKALARIANERGMLVIEDDAYNDLRFRGEKKPTLYSLLEPGNGLFFGTLSKTIAAGLRVGYAVGPEPVVAAMASGRVDSLRNSYSAALADWYLRTGRLESHIKELREIYRAKCEQMLATLEREMPEGVRWTKPNGGFFLWVTLPQGLSAVDLLPEVRAAGVDYIPGTAFHNDGKGAQSLRLSYSAVTSDQIEQGIGRLAGVIKLALSRVASPAD